MFRRFFGEDRKPATLSQRDWDRFIRARRAGKVGPSGLPVSDRTVERDLRFLLAVLNWGTRSRNEAGGLLLDSNPLKGLRVPREKNPRRVVLSQAEYEALLRVSAKIDWRFRVALVLAHETGHRIGAIRQLRWSDVDMGTGVIRWRAEHEKSGFEHRTPVTAEGARCSGRGAEGEPASRRRPCVARPRDPGRSMSHGVACYWWKRAGGACRAGAQAGQELAFAEAQVCLGPHGPATQGALRTRRLEDGTDGAPVLPEAR